MTDPIRALKAVADRNRMRMLVLLNTCGECCVCDMQAVFEVSLSTVSRALKQLEDGGWVISTRRGKWVYYRLAETLTSWQEELIGHMSEGKDAGADQDKFNEMKANKIVCN